MGSTLIRDHLLSNCFFKVGSNYSADFRGAPLFQNPGAPLSNRKCKPWYIFANLFGSANPCVIEAASIGPTDRQFIIQETDRDNFKVVTESVTNRDGALYVPIRPQR